MACWADWEGDWTPGSWVVMGAKTRLLAPNRYEFLREEERTFSGRRIKKIVPFSSSRWVLAIVRYSSRNLCRDLWKKKDLGV